MPLFEAVPAYARLDLDLVPPTGFQRGGDLVAIAMSEVKETPTHQQRGSIRRDVLESDIEQGTGLIHAQA
jgi:hypothetical protein